jgi:hypothetical protein
MLRSCTLASQTGQMTSGRLALWDAALATPEAATAVLSLVIRGGPGRFARGQVVNGLAATPHLSRLRLRRLNGRGAAPVPRPRGRVGESLRGKGRVGIMAMSVAHVRVRMPKYTFRPRTMVRPLVGHLARE